MELTLAAVREPGGPLFTYGPLIHNPQVLELLRSKGVQQLDQIPPAGSRSGGTVIIRAHGVPPGSKHDLAEAGFSRVVDGTCPRVVRVQAIIARAAKQGRDIVIVGDAHHAEVVGLLGHSRGRGRVVSDPAGVDDLPPLNSPVCVAQTTQSEEKFLAVVEALRARCGQVEVHDTICPATHQRQDEVRRLAREVDGVVVVGGVESGNTRRLAEVAASEGKLVMAVESETELDRDSISHLGSVGVTAGASTPNWMIKRVVRELTYLRSRREGRLLYLARRAYRVLVRGQFLVAVGAAGMSLAATGLQGLDAAPIFPAIAFFYIYAMHLLNHFLDTEAGQYNEPDRAQFLTKHSHTLIATGIVSGLIGLMLCLMLGWTAFTLMTVMSILGVLYSVPVFPRRWERFIRIHRLKDIPGSKTLSASLAWGVVTAILPAVTFHHYPLGELTLAFGFVFGLVFLRCALFDVLDVQGDLIVGKETIPIFLSVRVTRRLLWTVSAALALVLIAAPWLNLATPLAWLLLIPLAGLAVMHLCLQQRWLMPGAGSEGLVELTFWLAGLASLIWYAFR